MSAYKLAFLIQRKITKEILKMKDLVKVNFESERPTVSGRDLHEALQVKTPYTQWIDRMKDYGFTENIDFMAVHKNVIRVDGTLMPQQKHDHQLTIQMAKELCMLQRTEIGKKCRKYFITIEEKWNSPESIMSRALQFAKIQLEKLKNQNILLESEISKQKEQITEMQPKAHYCDVVLNCKSLVPISTIAKDYGWSAAKMNQYLHEKGVQFKQGDIWLLYQKYAGNGYTKTKMRTYPIPMGSIQKTHTYWTQKGRLFIYELLRKNGIYPQTEQE